MHTCTHTYACIQVGVIDVNNVFVLWEGQATNLGEYHSHRPSYHASNLSGVTQFGFNSDRSKITEVSWGGGVTGDEVLQLVCMY